MRIPLICHTFWAGKMPQDLYDLKWAMGAKDDDILHYVWDEVSIGELGLDYHDLKKRYLNDAGVSNVVRLHAVHKDGGIWLDADFKAHKSLMPLFAWTGAWAAEQEPGRLCNAAFGAPPSHPWIKAQIDLMPQYERINAYGGVDCMNAVPREDLTIIPSHWVYSYRWDDAPEKRIPHPDAIVEHLWHGSWLPKHI